MKILAAIVVSIIIIVIIVSLKKEPIRKTDFTDRLKDHLASRDDYIVYISTNETGPPLWKKAIKYTASEITLKDQIVNYDDVQGFAVAYPNLQIMDQHPTYSILPDEITGLSLSKEQVSDVLTDKELITGNTIIAIKYGTSPQESQGNYSTTLTNISNTKLKIVRFAGYTPVANEYQLSTVTGKHYSAEEFKNWYDQKSEWLEPGQSVVDENNYGDPPSLWAYYFTTEDGKNLIAGKVIRE